MAPTISYIVLACTILSSLTAQEAHPTDVNFLLEFVNKLQNCVKRDPNLIRFYVANNISNTDAYKEILLNDTSSLENSGFILGSPLKVLVHGYNQNLTATFPQNVKDAYLKAKGSLNKNILIVDYGALANSNTESQLNGYDYFTCYIQAALNTATIGTRIAELIQFLVSNGYAQLNNTHIIGHSLGAHVAGFAANRLQELNSGSKVARFTALDPAAPGFRPNLLPMRPMTKDDAIFVDVLHTNQLTFGVLDPIGQVDFFLNFALFLQPPCVGSITLEGFFGATLPEIFTLGAWCSHGASTLYYALSISEVQPLATGTLTTMGRQAILGENCSPTTTPGPYLYFEGNFNYSSPL